MFSRFFDLNGFTLRMVKPHPTGQFALRIISGSEISISSQNQNFGPRATNSDPGPIQALVQISYSAPIGAL